MSKRVERKCAGSCPEPINKTDNTESREQGDGGVDKNTSCTQYFQTEMNGGLIFTDAATAVANKSKRK